jgi:hypothetical protein
VSRVPVVPHIRQKHRENRGLSNRVAQNLAHLTPNLAKVVAAWPSLPEPIKRAMLALTTP